MKPFPDGVHTSPAGALLMAHTILVGLKAPAVVSDLEIDAAAKKAGKTTRCKADKVEGGPEGVLRAHRRGAAAAGPEGLARRSCRTSTSSRTSTTTASKCPA